MNNIRFLAQVLPLKWLSLFISCVLSLVLLLGSAHSVSAQRQDFNFSLEHEVQLASPLVIDLDGDGKKEIILGSKDGYLTVVDGATLKIEWEKNVGDYLRPSYSETRIQTALAAADLDKNGTIEIVISTGFADPIDSKGPGAIIVLTNGETNPVTLNLMPGLWPRFARDELGNGNRPDGHPDGFTSTPSLGDIDGDGDLEIVVGGMDRRIHAFYYDGNNVPGWPLDSAYIYSPVRRESRSTAALADLDGDGIKEVIIGSNNYKIPACANPYLFYVLKATTNPPTILPGFPFETTQNIESSPAVGDINGDGSLDIIFGTGDFDESCGQPVNGKKVYAIDRFGQNLPGWPVATNTNMVNSPALGDLDNDGQPEVVIHTQDTLYAWHGDGSPVQGFPVTGGDFHLRHHAPVLADVNGDGGVDIVLASGQVFGGNGQPELEDRNKLRSPVVVVDQDGDGKLETVGVNHFNEHIGLHLKGYIFEETGAATGALPWPTFHRTDDRAGYLPTLYVLSGRVVDEKDDPVEGVIVKLESGEINTTDEDGNYVFGSLPAGEYVITVNNGGKNIFSPPERSVDLSSNTSVDDFVMRDEIFDIAVQVLQVNKQPLGNVRLRLNNGDTKTTGANGRVLFPVKAGDYTITPLTPELTYLPAEIEVSAQTDPSVSFYALPAPVGATVAADSSTEIAFDDTQGLETRVTFPEGLDEGEAVITSLLMESPAGYFLAGHTLDISLSSYAGAQADGLDQALPSSITIEIAYSDADLQSTIQSEELKLIWQSPTGWVDAESTCEEGEAANNDVDNQVFTASVCQLGTYALAGPRDRLMMPQLFGRRP